VTSADDVFLVLTGGLIASTALYSGHLKRAIAPSTVALLTGIAAGPLLREFLPENGPGRLLILEEAARITLAISLMTAALRFPSDVIGRYWKIAALAIAVLMPLMWGLTTLVTWAILRPALLSAVLLGAIATPTDPVVAGSLVVGRFPEEHLPEKLRFTISMESGGNDGLVFLFVYLPMMLSHGPAERPSDTGRFSAS
jgi:NhaP-type Na+/H+ or K+/H+ antiporter